MPFCQQDHQQIADSHTSDSKEQDRCSKAAAQQGQKTADLETTTWVLVLPAGGNAVTAKQKPAFREPTHFSSIPNS